MRPRSLVLFLATLGLSACDDDLSDETAPQISPPRAPTATGHYAKVRTALARAVEGFPADAAVLPRCSPGHQAVLVMGYNDARQLYAPSAPASIDFPSGPLDVASRNFNLGWLEQGKPVQAPDPYAWVTAVALFRPTRLSSPQLVNCRGTNDPLLNDCALTPGKLEGALVLFDLSGTPVCSNALRADGPFTLFLRGSERPDVPQRRALAAVLDGFFYYPTESPAPDATWRFLSLETVDIRDLSITIDGTLVQHGRRS